jgi:putative CocE/NonD family hydrolase
MRIPPKLTLRGTQLAGWVPDPAPRAIASGILFDADIEITLPDGTVLLADLFRPGMGPVPALMSWASYIKDTERLGGGPFIDESGVCPFTIKAGYAVIRVQPRGTGRSGGAAPDEMFSQQERRDAHDVIEWIAVQPWCDGKVGMTGMSQFAMAQLLTASTKPPHLKAIFPYKGMTDVYRHGFYKGGAPYTGAIELFTAFERAKPPRVPTGLRHALSYLLNYPRFSMETSDARKTAKSVRGFMRRTPPAKESLDGYVSRVFDHAFDDGDYWASKSVYSIIDAIDVPVCVATDYGAQGFHFFGAFELWHRLITDKFLFIGPPEYRFPWANYQQELVAWYDWQLKGVDNGYAALPRVRYWLRGAERWESSPDWPLPEAKAAVLYLQPGTGQGSANLALASEVPARTSRASYLAYSSENYVPPGLSEHEPPVLRYQSAPCPEPLKVVGPVKLALTIAASALDTYVVARLSDIAPDGTRTKLAWGWLMASHRTIDPARSNPTEIVHDHTSKGARQLTPGEPTPLEFSLTPIANLFGIGHRIELEITSQPNRLLSETNEGFDMFCWDPVPYPSRNHIHHGGIQPSRLTIAVCASTCEASSGGPSA